MSWHVSKHRQTKAERQNATTARQGKDKKPVGWWMRRSMRPYIQMIERQKSVHSWLVHLCSVEKHEKQVTTKRKGATTESNSSASGERHIVVWRVWYDRWWMQRSVRPFTQTKDGNNVTHTRFYTGIPMGVAHLYLYRGHTPSNTRDRRITHILQLWSSTKCSTSQPECIVVFFISYYHA